MPKPEEPQMMTPLTLTPSGLTSGANLIASAQALAQRAFLDELSPAQMAALPYLFEFWALPHQLPPKGDWRTWVILGGRGAGKTRAGAEWVRRMVEGPLPHAAGRARRVAIVAETMDQAREVMVF
ncbi:MAG: ATP-binding protein, partial [Paracoccaceae bacterium]|nr:ATP-binding protein [Paracoccaceae bacterium]